MADSIFGTFPVVPSTTAEDSDTALSWMEKWLPDATAYWNNLGQGMTDMGSQLSQQAMEAYAAKMNEFSNLFNENYGAVTGQTEQSNNILNDALATMSGLYDQAQGAVQTGNADSTATLQDYIAKANMTPYLNDVQTGTVNPAIQAILDEMRAKEIQSTQELVQRAANETLGTQLERMGVNRTLDSTRTENIMQKVGYDQTEQLNQAIRDIENRYSAQSLSTPTNILNAAISTLPSLAPMGQLATAQQTGGTNLANLLGNAATGIGGQAYNTAAQGYDMANKNLVNTVNAGTTLSALPENYLKMAQMLPDLATAMGSDYLKQLTDIWQAKLDAQVLRENIQAQKDINSSNNDVSFWDILF